MRVIFAHLRACSIAMEINVGLVVPTDAIYIIAREDERKRERESEREKKERGCKDRQWQCFIAKAQSRRRLTIRHLQKLSRCDI